MLQKILHKHERLTKRPVQKKLRRKRIKKVGQGECQTQQIWVRRDGKHSRESTRSSAELHSGYRGRDITIFAPRPAKAKLHLEDRTKVGSHKPHKHDRLSHFHTWCHSLAHDAGTAVARSVELEPVVLVSTPPTEKREQERARRRRREREMDAGEPISPHVARAMTCHKTGRDRGRVGCSGGRSIFVLFFPRSRASHRSAMPHTEENTRSSSKVYEWLGGSRKADER